MYWPLYFIIENICSILALPPRHRPIAPKNSKVSSILRTTKNPVFIKTSIPIQASLKNRVDFNMVNKLEHGESLMRMAIRYTTRTHHRELELCAMMGQQALLLAEELALGMEVLHNGSTKA